MDPNRARKLENFPAAKAAMIDALKAVRPVDAACLVILTNADGVDGTVASYELGVYERELMAGLLQEAATNMIDTLGNYQR